MTEDTEQATQDDLAFDPDQDRYLTLGEALKAIQGSIENVNEPVERVEVTALANGEANCRWWTPRAEEPEAVFIPSQDHT